MAARRALIVVDMQNDFCDGGRLQVPNASAMIPRVNAVIAFCEANGIPCIFTRDWHPPEHQSFSKAGGRWPEHCVRGSWGARLAERLRIPANALIVDKGVDAKSDGYSAFQDTKLANALFSQGIKNLGICGVATEYCVAASVMDAVDSGFDVSVLVDLVSPINKDVGMAALQELKRHGATLKRGEAWMNSRV